MIVVSDAGPLIYLGGVGRLALHLQAERGEGELRAVALEELVGALKSKLGEPRQ